MTATNLTRSAAVLFIILATALSAPVQAQERRGARERDHERYRTPHWVFDDRYHHGHYYPSVGYSISVLPAGNIAISFRSGRFFFQSGVWYQPAPSGYVVVRPPVGIVVPVLPPAYSTVWMAGAPYYYANDTYYIQAPGGYAVATPPMDAPQGPGIPAPGVQPQAPGAPAQAAPGTWYYCDSAKGYYPYVATCNEAWRPVPAIPPPAR
jgi:hypothetical protein